MFIPIMFTSLILSLIFFILNFCHYPLFESGMLQFKYVYIFKHPFLVCLSYIQVFITNIHTTSFTQSSVRLSNNYIFNMCTLSLIYFLFFFFFLNSFVQLTIAPLLNPSQFVSPLALLPFQTYKTFHTRTLLFLPKVKFFSIACFIIAQACKIVPAHFIHFFI